MNKCQQVACEDECTSTFISVDEFGNIYLTNDVAYFTCMDEC